jgi:hypothetical protein
LSWMFYHLVLSASLRHRPKWRQCGPALRGHSLARRQGYCPTPPPCLNKLRKNSVPIETLENRTLSN